MSFTNYHRGVTDYTVCLECGAYGFGGPFTHDCDRDWPRFLNNCGCPACREYRSWHDTHTSIGEESRD